MKKTGKPGIATFLALLLLSGVAHATTAIHRAAMHGELDRVKALLDAKPELVNARDDDHRTPLHWAVQRAQRKVALYRDCSKEIGISLEY